VVHVCIGALGWYPQGLADARNGRLQFRLCQLDVVALVEYSKHLVHELRPFYVILYKLFQRLSIHQCVYHLDLLAHKFQQHMSIGNSHASFDTVPLL